MENFVNADGVLLDLNSANPAEDNEFDSCGAGEGGLDTKRTFSELDSLSDQVGFNDTGDGAKEDGFDGKEGADDKCDDPIFNEIKDSIARCHSSAKSHTSSSDGSEASPHVKVSNKFMSLPYGLIPWASYEHGKRSGDIMGVTYNGRMRQFVILDSKGITTWKRDAVEHRVSRDLHYPKYEYRLITNVIYAKKHNCYFVLGKDFSLKVYNRDFYETCSVSADLRSVLFMLFNPVRDELITGGVGGTKVWRFHQQSGITPTMLRPLANYGLTLKYELPSVGGSWVKRVELDHHLEHLYCCSDTDLHVYDLAGKILFKFERAHMMSITGCRYSQAASVLVTSSIDCEVKVWSLLGGLIHTFRGHSRAVTNLILHPATSSIVLTCSLDGTVRMWSLDTMDCLYSLVVSADGLLWMGLTDDNMLFISTARTVTLWHMNYNVQFWALARSRVTRMELCGCKEKTTRLMAISEDSSVRLMARSNRKNLCTVLPPPSISPLQRVLSVCYSRQFNTIYMLINPHEIWVYTTRTDPACRIAVWDVIDIQACFVPYKQSSANAQDFNPSTISVNKPVPSHRATESGAGAEPVANCCCLSILNSTAILWTDEGCCCPIRDSYLLLGLEDGRILFMDPVKKGHKYLEFKTGKDPVLDMYHDTAHQSLVTVYKLPGLIQIHVWGLPDLELQHEIYTSPDLRGHARLGYLMATAHESGSVMFHSLELATDPGLHKPKMAPVLEEVVDVHHKPQHQAPVIGLDVCASLRIFASCSKDGAVKIWTEEETLLTEIMLDDTLTSACFLNNMGDLVVGYQKQVFYIDHTKVCPQLTVPESDVDTFDKESFICEDPAVMYEGVSPNPDPVTLNNYLVPFDIEFSKDFLEGKVTLEPEAAKEEESDGESVHSQAPTEIYLSPAPTPRRHLSLVDLTLGSEINQHDLLSHMKKTLEHLAEKERVDAAQIAFEQLQEDPNRSVEARRRRRRLARARGGSVDEKDGRDAAVTAAAAAETKEPVVTGGLSDASIMPSFSFPRFGESPGPTPRSTPAGSPEVLSEAEDVEDITTEEDTSVKKVTVEVVKVEEKEDEISKFLAEEKDKETKAEEQASTTPRPKRKFGFSSVTVDAKSLMKEGKKVSSGEKRKSGSEVTSPRKGGDSDSDAGEKKGKRSERGSKKMLQLSQRKISKQRKPEKEMPDPREPPPTQIQAVEEQTLKKRAEGGLELHGSSSEEDLQEEKKPVGKRRPRPEEADSSAQPNRELEKKSLASASSGSLGDKTGRREGEDRETVDKPPSGSGIPPGMEAVASSGIPETSVAAVKPGSGKSRLSDAQSKVSWKHEDPSDVESLVSRKSQSQGHGSVGGERSDEVVKSEAGAKSVTTAGESFDPDGRKSALSADGSEDSKAAFRLSLLTKQTLDEDVKSEGGLSVPDEQRHRAVEQQSTSQPSPQPYVRECRKDAIDGKSRSNAEHVKKSNTARHKGRGTGKPLLSSKADSATRSAHGMKSSQGKKSSPPSNRAHQASGSQNDSNPDDLLAAYFEKQRAKEASINAVHVLSVSDAEELLKAVGRKKPPSPILEDEDAEEEEENRTASSALGVDWASSRLVGSRSSVTDTLAKPEIGLGRALSSDASTVRATTPSVSIIENESVWSASSPAPSIGRGLNSPLPTLSEVPLASSPIPTSEPKLKLDGAEKQNKNVEKGVMSGSDSSSAVGTTSKIEIQSKKTANASDLKEKVVVSAPSVSSISLCEESTTNISDSKTPQNLHLDGESLIKKNKSNNLTSEPNYGRPVSSSKSDSDSKGVFSTVSEGKTEDGEDAVSSEVDEADGPEWDMARSGHPTGPAPVEKIDIVRRYSGSEKSLSTLAQSSVANTIPEEGEDAELNGPGGQYPDREPGDLDDVVKAEQDNDGVFTPGVALENRYEGSDLDSSERTWDSDFDASFMGSVGELSSTLSASDEDSKANSRGGGSASSSSNAEQVMKVRIRKKQLRQRRMERPPHKPSEVSSPRDPSMALRRMLSQNDALTVQRNAQLERARHHRKRARSAVEGGAAHHRAHQEGQALSAARREHINQCVLCAAEGAGQHAEHSKVKATTLPSDGTADKEKRRISFKDEARESSSKPSPRLPRSGRSSVSQASPRDAGSRRSSLTQPSPRESNSRRSSVTQPSPGGSDARRSVLSNRSPRGKKGSSRQEADMRAPTPAALTAPTVTSEPRPSATPDASTRERMTPTTIETPELSGYARPPSQILSDVALGSPLDSEVLREGAESAFGFGSEFRSTLQENDGVGTPDSGWTEQDIISVSRQHVRSADPQMAAPSDLDETSDYHRGRPGMSLLDDDELQVSRGDTVPEVKVTRDRPNTSTEDRALQRPELQSAVTFFRQRPHTAQVRFKRELELIMELPKSHKDLQTAFDTSLVRYKKLSRNPLTSDTLYRNADQAFSEDWHERQVERHMLIRMQKELRSQNAERRRLAIQAQKQELLQRRLQAQETQLFERRTHPSPTPPTPPGVPARASTVHGSRPAAAMHAPAPTPVSSRPHTASGGREARRKGIAATSFRHHQHHHQHHQQQHQYTSDSIERQIEAEAGRRLKAELGQERPFRFKLREPEAAESTAPAVLDLGESIDPWLLDPRNPRAVRPKSSKSIPSKCHRYVLVTKPKTHLQIPLPSPLEEQLLATRFPQQGEKVFRQYEGLLFRPIRRPEYGINYSPLSISCMASHA